MARIVGATMIALFLAVGGAARVNAESGVRVTKVRAYLVGWNVLTRTRLTAEDVARIKSIAIEINDAGLAQNFVTWLRLGDLKERPRGEREPADARLTIELVHDDGTTELYYADRAALYSGDSRKSRPVDQEFLDRFDIARK